MFQNISYLSFLQGFNLILPLITYPYLIRVLGKDTYGLVVLVQAIVGYLVILVNFGFSISATREISLNRNDIVKKSEIISSVFQIKIILLIVSFLILGFLLLAIDWTHGYKVLFFLSMWACFYDVVFPIWYFQGIEQMKYITIISLISRLLFLCLIFVFIKSSADYLFVPLLNGIGALIAGVVSLAIIFGKHKIKFKIQPINVLKYYFKSTLTFFISNISINLYVNTNKVIVGAFLGLTEVSYYDLAEKITNVLKIPQGILSQSIFPKISKEKNVNFIRKAFRVSVLMNVALILCVLIFSKYIILLLGGEQMLPARVIVNILILSIPIIALSDMFGLQMLVPFGFIKSYRRIIFLTLFFYILLMLFIWLVFGFSLLSISFAILGTELFGAIGMHYYCKKHGLWK
jgi:O-antigen/teichoic acid export membrane protein